MKLDDRKNVQFVKSTWLGFTFRALSRPPIYTKRGIVKDQFTINNKKPQTYTRGHVIHIPNQ